jgi:putative serine protease PepD
MRRLKSLAALLGTLVGSLSVCVLPATPQNMQSVAAAASRSVCIVLAERANATTSGTGFMVADGFVLTAHRLVQNADRMRVLCPDHPAIDVKLVNADADNDVALLQSTLLTIRPLPLGASATVQVGQQIVVIGFPRADLVGPEIATVTQGIVNSVRGGALQIQAPVGPGNSGSPVLTLQGQVIAVVRAVLGNQVGTNIATSFATAIDAAKPFLTSALGGLYGSVNVGNAPPAPHPPKPAPTSSGFVITAGQGIGDLKLGMHRDEIEHLVGLPKHVFQNADGGSLVDWYEMPGAHGFFAVFSPAGAVILIGVSLDPRYAVQGLHTGDREVEVRAALGEPSRVELSAGTYLHDVNALKLLFYDSLGLRFVVQNNPKYAFYGLVSAISVSRPGCVIKGWPGELQSGTCQ